MRDTFNVIPESSKELLRTLEGKKIDLVSLDRVALIGTGFYDSYIESPDFPIDSSYVERLLTQQLTLQTQKLTLSLLTTEIANREDEYPDLALVEAHASSPEQLSNQCDDLASFTLGETVQDIEIVDERVVINKSGSAPFTFTNTKAIIIHCDTRKVIAEKNCFWAECWTVSILPKDTAYDFFNQWTEKPEDDPATYQMTLVRTML